MPNTLAPYVDLAKDAGLALTDADYAYGLLVSAAPLLTLAGLLVLVGLIATHGKSHGTRFSALALFVFASLAGLSAYLLRPDAAGGTVLGGLLAIAWLPPLIVALAVFATMAPRPKPRALALAGAAVVAIAATLFGGMLSVANARTLNPDAMVWLDAPPMDATERSDEDESDKRKTLPVVDTAAHK